jgi:putative transposase
MTTPSSVSWPRRACRCQCACWHARYHNTGSGHLYQGRFKSFPVQTDEHFLTVCRYVERNALRAGFVQRAEDWRGCSLWQRRNGTELARKLLSEWPVGYPAGL